MKPFVPVLVCHTLKDLSVLKCLRKFSFGRWCLLENIKPFTMPIIHLKEYTGRFSITVHTCVKLCVSD